MEKIYLSSITNPDKTGFLTKQGHVIKNWKKRWFVLKDSSLYYFRDNNDKEEAAGFMEIEGATVEEAQKKTWKKYSFEIATKEKSLFLYADTEDDAQEWIYILSRACSSMKDQLVKKPDSILNVKGICCDKCEEKLKSSLSIAVGAHNFEVNLEDETVKVPGEYEVLNVIRALEDVGFVAYL